MTAMGTITETMQQPRAAPRASRKPARNLAVLVSLTLVMLAAIAALFLMQGVNNQLNDVVHTYEVRNQARELTIALSQAESAQRGYLLTRDDSFIEPYRRAATAIGTRLVTLNSLTQDDPQQASRVRAIAGEITSHAADMQATMDLIQNQRAGEARQLLQSGLDENAMSGLQDALEQFLNEENVKLLDRNRQIDMSRRWLVAAIITALAAAVILAYALFIRAQRQVRALDESRAALSTENEVLEAHVLDRTKALEEARAHAELERQRVETLLQDTNHRIGNSLATVSSLLGLQLIRSKSPEVQEALEAARSRVHAIASAHRRLRLGTDLETASADDFLTAVLEDISNTADDTDIVMEGHFEPIIVPARDATTIGILTGELVTNAYKHAFPDERAGSIIVRFARSEDGVPTLSVSDDGVGIEEGSTPEGSGLGSVIVRQLSGQFGGQPIYQRRPQGGTLVTISMPQIGISLSDPH